MANEVLTVLGKPVLTPSRLILRKKAVGAPAVDGVIVRLVGGEAGEIEISEALPAEVLGARVVWLTESDSISRRVPDATLLAMKAGAGTFPLAFGRVLLGRLYGSVVTGARLVLRFSEGEALAEGPRLAVPSEDPEVPFVVDTLPSVTGPLTEGAAVAYTPADWTGGASVEITHVFRLTDDTSATNPGAHFAPTSVVPTIDGTRDCLQVGVYAIGPGVPGDPEDPTIYWGTPVQIAAADVTTPVTLNTAAIFVANRIDVDGLVAPAPVVGDTLVSGGASAKIVGFVAGASGAGTIFTGPITGGTIADNAAVGWTSGGTASANGAALARGLIGGEPFYWLGPGWNGTPTSEDDVKWEIADASTGPWTVIDLSGSLPPWYGLKFLKATWRVTGYGIPGDPGYLEHTTGAMEIDIPTLAPLTTAQWFIEAAVAAGPGSGDRVVAVWVRDDLNPTLVRWTTSSQAQIDANPYPSGHELCTRTATTQTVDSVVFRRWTTADAIYGTPPKNYVVFLSTDSTRRTQFGLVYETGGARSPLGNRQSVPEIDVPPTGAVSTVSRFIGRSQRQRDLGEAGGACMQYPRGWGVDGDYVWMSFDVTGPAESFDRMVNWEVDSGIGLTASASTMGAEAFDGKYVVAVMSVMGRRTQGNHASKEGIYRKNRLTGLWSLVHAMTPVLGTNGALRENLKHVCLAKGSGSTSENRTLFALDMPASSAATLDTFRLLKSTNSGGSWAYDGAALSIATHGTPLWMIADETAIYIATKTRVIRRAFAPGSSWTVATGLPSGSKNKIEKHGTKIMAVVEGQGLYTANDAGTLAFTLKKSFPALWFSASPANPDRIVLTRNNNTVPWTLYTRNDGVDGWPAASSQPYPGQPNDFAHRISGNATWVEFHPTDPDVCYAFRFQHPGRSDDGGRAFGYASNNMDYSQWRTTAFHPTDYKRMVAGMVDRLMTAFDHGAAFAVDDAVSDNDKDAIKDIIEATPSGRPDALAVRGALLLVRGTRTGYVGQIGKNNELKTPVILARSVTDSRTAAAAGNGTISYTASPDLPAGEYTLTCTTAAANGGTFTGLAPLGVSMGTWTVGVERTWTDARGGTLTATINDGSTDFRAGANPAVFTITVNPIGGARTILNPSVKDASVYSQANPVTTYRGISGRHVFEMATNGTIALTRTIDFSFAGYMGRGGSIILGYDGNTTLKRSTNEGLTWSTWASGLQNFNGKGTATLRASSHDSQRAYTGTVNGRVQKVQNGVATTIFDFDGWCTDNGISGDWPGTSVVNGRQVPIVSGVAESWFDPNLVYCSTFIYGADLNFFRTKNALAASAADVEWENITRDVVGRGLPQTIEFLDCHPLTDEVLLYSSHGTVMEAPEAAHRAAYSIANSLIDDLRAQPGGAYHATQPI